MLADGCCRFGRDRAGTRGDVLRHALGQHRALRRAGEAQLLQQEADTIDGSGAGALLAVPRAGGELFPRRVRAVSVRRRCRLCFPFRDRCGEIPGVGRSGEPGEGADQVDGVLDRVLVAGQVPDDGAAGVFEHVVAQVGAFAHLVLALVFPDGLVLAHGRQFAQPVTVGLAEGEGDGVGHRQDTAGRIALHGAQQSAQLVLDQRTTLRKLLGGDGAGALQDRAHGQAAGAHRRAVAGFVEDGPADPGGEEEVVVGRLTGQCHIGDETFLRLSGRDRQIGVGERLPRDQRLSAVGDHERGDRPGQQGQRQHGPQPPRLPAQRQSGDGDEQFADHRDEHGEGLVTRTHLSCPPSQLLTF